ncbi:MAG: arsenite methyltransferase [Bacteroidota bacterium]|nr:arsenite methyltransferase [Bacteroidota bacterium]
MDQNNDHKDMKRSVRKIYSEIARGRQQSCCGTSTSCCGPVGAMTDGVYEGIGGYIPETDLGLGCGVPTEFAGIEPGMTVVDLGSGAGIDAFIAARLVGPTGFVIGVDMTTEMIERANENKSRLNVDNVEFRLGEIERLPVDDASVDVVISNCVLNLVPNKERAFRETARVLKSGGWFCVSDIVLEGEIPPEWRDDPTMYAGCISGAAQKAEFIAMVERAGFQRIEIVQEKEIPPSFLDALLTEKPAGQAGKPPATVRVFSITVRGVRP